MPNKPHERLAYLDNCVRKMFKQYSKTTSPIDGSEPMASFGKDGVIDRDLKLSALSPSIGGGMLKKETIILSQGQYVHVFPHTYVLLKCSLCDQTCPSNTPTENMMVLFNSPSSLFPLCTRCSKSLGKFSP